jgi:hypothetical protein
MNLRNWVSKLRPRRHMRVIVFIGHHKTGSTALQAHLARHAPAALRAGILYPSVTQEDQTAFDWIFDAGDAEQPLSRNVSEAHNALAFSMIHDHNPAAPVPPFHSNLPSTGEMFSLIRRQIARYRPHTLVLASEVFANFTAISPALIADLVDGLGLNRSGAEIELFASLRRVDDYLASWHAQRLRMGQKVPPLPKALPVYQRGVHFDYRLMLEGWQQVLPQARLTLAPYDRALRAQGMPRAFAEEMRLDLPGLEGAPRRANTGLHRGLLEIARQGARALEPGEAHKLFLTLMDLTPELDLPVSQDVELWGAEARAQMLADFAPIHDWLSGQYGQVFFPDLDEIGVSRPLREAQVTVQALAQIRRAHMGAFSPAGQHFLAGLGAADAPFRRAEHMRRAG